MRRASPAAGALMAALLLAGCGGSSSTVDQPTTGASTSSATTKAPSTTASPTTSAAASTTAPSTAATTSAAGPPFVADTRDQVGEPRGQSEVVTGVRASTETGYEQVAFTVKGDPGAQPGFRAGYVASPEADPSGKPVQVKGNAYLQVFVSGVSGTPPPDEIVNGTFPGTGAAIAQVVVGPAFEGMHQFFIGLDEKRPFRVQTGADPGQVVVQLLTS